MIIDYDELKRQQAEAAAKARRRLVGYIAIGLGLVWFAAFAIYGLINLPELTWLGVGLLCVNVGGCALVLGLHYIRRKAASS
jgi:hypothetical protein